MITIGHRIVHRAKLFLPWAGRWVLRAWFAGTVPSGKVTVQWGKTQLVGTVVDSKSGEVVGESVATIVGGIGWQTAPPAVWLIDNSASPVKAAQQLAQSVDEVIELGDGALQAGRSAFARPGMGAAEILELLLTKDAPWWVELDGTTRAALDRPAPVLSADRVIEFDAEARTCTLDLDEPSGLIGATIAAEGERLPVSVRVYEAHVVADETGVHCLARLEKPSAAAPTVAAHLEALTRNQRPAPHASWRGATVQSQTAQREVSLRLDARDKELPDSLPVPAWSGVPGVSAEVFSGTRTFLAFDRHDGTNPFAALWSPYGQTGHVPKKVFHEAHEELRFVGSSAGIGRFGTITEQIAKAPLLVAYLRDLEAWALSVDLAVGPLIALLPPPAPADYAAAVAARVSSAVQIDQIPATKLEAE